MTKVTDDVARKNEINLTLYGIKRIIEKAGEDPSGFFSKIVVPREIQESCVIQSHPPRDREEEINIIGSFQAGVIYERYRNKNVGVQAD